MRRGWTRGLGVAGLVVWQFGPWRWLREALVVHAALPLVARAWPGTAVQGRGLRLPEPEALAWALPGGIEFFVAALVLVTLGRWRVVLVLLAVLLGLGALGLAGLASGSGLGFAVAHAEAAWGRPLAALVALAWALAPRHARERLAP